MAVETSLAKHHWDRVKSRDRTLTYNKLDRKHLEALAPGYDWGIWLKAYGVKPVDEVVVRQPDYFTAMAKMLDEVPIDDWKIWLKWHVLHEAAPFLSKSFVDEDFAFFGKTLTGTPEIRPRWKRGWKSSKMHSGKPSASSTSPSTFPPKPRRG